MDRQYIKFKKMLYKCHTSAIWQQAAHTTYQLSSPSSSARTIQKRLTINKNIWVFWKKKSEKWTISRKNCKTERARSLGRKKEKSAIRKGNQMTALKFQTGEWHQTSPASLQGSAGRALDQKAGHNTDAGLIPQCSKGFFSQSQLTAKTLTVFAQPPCAVTCVNICAHTDNPKHRKPTTVWAHRHATHTDRNG